MGFARVMSRAQAGLAAPLVAVEVHLGSGLPQFNIVGLPAAAVKESRERVRAALATCGFELPAGRITVNLAPADLPKEGGRYDLPIALGVLLASGQIEPGFDVDRTEFYGELALTGELKPVPGLLLAALHAGRAGHSLVVPSSNLVEVRAADARARGLGHLRSLSGNTDAADADNAGSGAMTGTAAPAGTAGARVDAPATRVEDLADVRGQHQAKRALLLAAAGGHSLLMIGPPGSGKTMLAQRLPGLLPPLDAGQALETAAIAAVAPASLATRSVSGAASTIPPFRSPHHTSSAHAVIGGGTSVQPGEISLAHHGVLFLDELPEFDRRVLESLREPLESGRIHVARTNQRAEFPASFLLVAAMNPCPCGRHGMLQPKAPCRCTPQQVERYRARISGPLLDRIDLQLRLPQVTAAQLVGNDGQSDGRTLHTAQARELVQKARQRQLARQGCLNARLGPTDTLQYGLADAAGRSALARAAGNGASARAQHRMLRVARTIADLSGRNAVAAADIIEAASLRIDE